MERLTRWVLAHRRWVVAGWLVLAAAGAGTAALTTSRLVKTFDLPGARSYRVDAQIARRFDGLRGDPTVPVLTAPPGVTVTGPAGRPALRAAARAATLDGRFRVLDALNTRDRRFILSGNRTTFFLVFTPESGFGGPDPTAAITQAVQHALPSGWRETTTGSGQLQSATGQHGGPGVLGETLLGGAGALIILVVVFSSGLAVLPLIGALVAIPTTFLLLLGLTTVTPINFVVQFLIGLVGLGVAIDYALLVTTRWREETQSRPPDEAVVVAMATAGRSVVFSGITVAVGLLALALLPVPFLRSMAFGGVLIPLVSVAVALTLLPVCLSAFGPRLDRRRFRRADSASPPWLGWARLVNRHRFAAVLIGAVLAGLALTPVLDLQIGQPALGSLAVSGAAEQGLRSLVRHGVPVGALSPLDVLVRPGGRPETATRALATVPGVWTVTDVGSSGGFSLLAVLPHAEAGGPGGTAVVQRVESAARAEPAIVGVGGSGPETIDFDRAIYGKFPLMLGLVSLIVFLILARAFRSLVLAAKAVLLNLLTLGCAYGVVVFVWEQGHGSQVIFGLPATGTVTDWIPVVMFAFLFGLAIDYEVFIISRMREVWDATGNTAGAVIDGLGRTGRLVTSAALILTFAFIAMSTAPLSFLKVLATGLAAGILIDAFLVRALLVPALVSALGRWNWVSAPWPFGKQKAAVTELVP